MIFFVHNWKIFSNSLLLLHFFLFYIFQLSIKIEENLLVVTKEELQKKLAKELKETDYMVRACCREEIRLIKEHKKQNAVIKNPHISSSFLSGLLLCNFFLLINASQSDKSTVIFSSIWPVLHPFFLGAKKLKIFAPWKNVFGTVPPLLIFRNFKVILLFAPWKLQGANQKSTWKVQGGNMFRRVGVF